MAIQRYKQRPPIVDAMQFTNNQDEIIAWCPVATFVNGKLLLYQTIEVKKGEWVVTGVCENWSKFGDCFLDCYDPVEGGGTSFK